MKRSMFAVALLFCLPTATFAAAPCADGVEGAMEQTNRPSGTFDASRVLVTMHQGRGGTLIGGMNDVDTPLDLNCEGINGCMLTAFANVDSNVAGFYVCIFVDGKPLQAHPWNNSSIALQGNSLTTGSHTVQTKVRSNAGKLGPWSILYTLYEN